MNYTYDVVFNDSENSNNKGWHETFKNCMNYISATNGTNQSYFADYKGGTVAVKCNETNEIIYEVAVI